MLIVLLHSTVPLAPNTTFVGFNIVDSKSTTGAFRVAASGIIEDINSSVEIVKIEIGRVSI